ncbi:BON domain-containing protein [Solimonas sp. K1W22B-7]|uniref:BON domain-containing protein n=1 Tax=Solimonas sp. K1W22B-7 TaxID=2303331 RepID=UPI000E330029|nr:BON domain-containing protein [Solimonas sp. K1W22B-7]AXQ28626.1 BON domain-containing protein [Solimonas sp. K1W22B-7]
MLFKTLLLATAVALSGTAVASVQTDPAIGNAESQQYLSDAAVTAQVKSALLGQKNLDALDINVSTRNGVVQLSGFAGSSAQISQAVEVARNVRGVREVKNDLRLKTAR